MLAAIWFTIIGLTTVGVAWGCYITARYPTAWCHRLPPVAPVIDDEVYLTDAPTISDEWVGLL